MLFANCEVFERGKSNIDFNLEVFSLTKIPMTSYVEVSVMTLYL